MQWRYCKCYREHFTNQQGTYLELTRPRQRLTFLCKQSGFMRLADDLLFTCRALPPPGKLY